MAEAMPLRFVPSLVADAVEVEDDTAGGEAVDAEEIPLAALEPGAEPAQCGESGEKAEDHAEAGSEEAGVHGYGVSGGGSSGEFGFAAGVEDTQQFAGDGQRRDDD